MANLSQELSELMASIAQEPQTPDTVTWDNLAPDLKAFFDGKREVQIVYPNKEIVNLKSNARRSADFFKIIDDLTQGNNVFLVGEAGTGKTFTAREVSKALNREQMTINCNQWTTPREIKGGETIEGYKEGVLIQCWEFGRILILDELPKLDPNTAGILNEALALVDKTGKDSELTTGEGRKVQKHPSFGCIATGNTTGKNVNAKYGGNNRQDASLIDRFSSCYYFIQFDRDLEWQTVHGKVFEICDKMRDVLIKEEADDIITLRTMLSMNRIYTLEMERTIQAKPNEQGKTLKDSVLSYFSVLDEDMKQAMERQIDFKGFFNSYKDVRLYEKEKKDFATMNRGVAPKKEKPA